MWQKAALHHNGKGLEEGADLTLLRKHIAWLRKKGNKQAAGLLVTIAAAGLWCQNRKYEASLTLTRACPWCGKEVQDDYHLVWDCPVVNEDEHSDIVRTNYLRRHAKKGVREFPCYWLRGITPKWWTYRDWTQTSMWVRSVGHRDPYEEFMPLGDIYLNGMNSS